MTDPRIQGIINKHFPPESHPYRKLEGEILRLAQDSETILEIGCGRHGDLLGQLRRKMPQKMLIGVDPVAEECAGSGVKLIRGSACDMPEIPSQSVDLVFSRSVMEHIEDVDRCYREIKRILRPPGYYVFLTPSRWDYVSLIAQVVPNAWHGAVVGATEGRASEDVFPTFYRSNSKRDIELAADRAGFGVVALSYLGQYPAAFLFSETAFRIMSYYHRLLERFGPAVLRGWVLCVIAKYL